jgi:polygalacturonase
LIVFWIREPLSHRASGAGGVNQPLALDTRDDHANSAFMKPLLVALSLVLCFHASQQVAGSAIVVDVRESGAKGDKTTNDAVAIQSAITACSKAGGGAVRVPSGDYLCGPIKMESGVTLRLDTGATLWASTNKNEYGSGNSGHFLTADGARDIALTGGGTINGQGTADYGSRWGVPQAPSFRTGVLLFSNSRNIRIEGVTIRNSDAWTLHFKRCEDIVIDGVTIRNNYRRLNSDGIDPNMCRNVRITRCRISAGDDCIVLKTTDPFPCENVTITDCILESAASALKLGTESKGDFRNVLFANCVVTNSPTGLGFYVKDGGIMENVVFSNIVVSTPSAGSRSVSPIFMDIERRNADSKIGKIRNVRFEKIQISSGTGILIQGMPESPIEKLVLKDIHMQVTHADDYSKRTKPVGGRRTTKDSRDTAFARLPSYFTVAHARGVQVENLSVDIADAAFQQFDRSAFCGRYIEDLTLKNVRRNTGRETGKVPVVDLQDCSRVVTEKSNP